MGIAAARAGSRDCISITNGTQQSYLLDDTHPFSAILFGGPSRVPSAPLHNMIRLENLSKEYEATSQKDSRVVAADRLNLEVPSGEIFGLVGPNGAGKTTTLKMICGLSVPTAGKVLINGVDVERAPEEAQMYMGYLADFFSLYDELKVWEYIEYFAYAYKLDPAVIPARVDEVIRWVGLHAKRDAEIAGLSRGMKQRLGIARAIVHDPPLIVLDEPAAGLDPRARVELKDLLRELHRNGKTIFITSHILADLQEICTSIAIMEKGRLLRVGRLDEVMGRGNRRAVFACASPLSDSILGNCLCRRQASAPL